MKLLSLFTTIGLLVGGTALGEDYSRYYRVTPIPTPGDVNGQVGGIDLLPDGRMAVAFHHGEVGFIDVRRNEWTIFARGLHEPLGVVALSDSSIMVMQRPELTKITDTDGDGIGDLYETITDEFGMTGNYHEFAFGPVRDANGDFFISLNVASNGAGIREEIRGDWLEVGMERERFYTEEWKDVKKEAGRMYSRVPWRGWIMKVDGETGEMTPWASGFRSPNGLGFDADGNLFATDNQGDWIGTSPLYHVEEGNFYGHVASVPWMEDWDGRDPLEVPTAEFDQMRTRPALQFPQGIVANSPTQILTIDSDEFSTFNGQLLVGEMNYPRLLRVMMEEVAGVKQGAVVNLLDGGDLNLGNHRFAFDERGKIVVGQTHLSWAGGQGMQHIDSTGVVPPDVLDISLTNDGFDLTFTKPFDVETLENSEHYAVASYYYEYHAAYGSPQMDKSESEPVSVVASADGTKVSLKLPELKAGYVYQLDLTGLKDADGEPILNPMVCYTINRLRDGTAPEPQIPGS